MESLNKTIKKLTDQEYQDLLTAVAGRKNNKPYLVLEAARNHNYDETGMIEMLGVNPSTYYTLKSRLNEKIAQYLSKNLQNPINVLKEKVALVPAMMFGNDRQVAIRALKNLEKQLIEYDLSNELITVYKALARLSMYNQDYDYYEREYNRHVAYSLAVVKAEDLFFEFNKKAGFYQLTREEQDFENLQTLMREMTNISELYHGHRLFVLFNITRLYFLCINTTRRENLQALELEIDKILQQIKKHFESYDLDTFYQSIKFIPDFLYFQYYTQTGNQVRADYHYHQIYQQLGSIAAKPVFSFYVIQFLQAKVDRYLLNKDVGALCDSIESIESSFELNTEDPYAFISFKRYLSIARFYKGDYNGSAKTLNSIRNEMSLKRFFHSDIECKLFQALNYCMIGEDSLCSQLIQSVKRQIAENESEYESTAIFIKMIKAAMKPEEFRRKVAKLTEHYQAFIQANNGPKKMLAFLQLDEQHLRRMANPIKE